MSVYDLDKLITETRRLAADYRRATGRSLTKVKRLSHCVWTAREGVS